MSHKQPVKLKKYNLIYPIRDNQVLLGRKLRKMGAGKWNGFGGKVEGDETIEQAAIRELHEESGILAQEKDLIHIGWIRFLFTDKQEWDQHVDVYLVHEFEGEPQDTDEMLPKWFSIDDLPFENMWVADPEWVPIALSETYFEAEVWFSDEGNTMNSIEFFEPKTS